MPLERVVRLRPARREDAVDLAQLTDLAGEGLPRYLWARLAEPGEDIWAVGARRAARDDAAFSWRNAVLAEVDGRVAGGLVTYRTPEAPEPLDDLPPIARPLQELEDMAPGSQYVNALAIYPAFRRRGLAKALLEEAAERAAGAAELSVIVADRNAPALGLYLAAGYVERARRALVKDGWICDSAEWVLLARPAGLAVGAEPA